MVTFASCLTGNGKICKNLQVIHVVTYVNSDQFCDYFSSLWCSSSLKHFVAEMLQLLLLSNEKKKKRLQNVVVSELFLRNS